MRWLIGIVGTIVAIGLLVTVVGALLPRAHVAVVTARIAAPPAVVFAALTDPVSFPKWRPDVLRVEPLPPVGGLPAWREIGKDRAITFAMQTLDPPRRVVTRITDESLPFGGSWEYVVAPDGNGARVTITERGEVSNPIFRFVSHFFMSPSATAVAYLRALGRQFGSEPVPDVLSSKD